MRIKVYTNPSPANIYILEISPGIHIYKLSFHLIAMFFFVQVVYDLYSGGREYRLDLDARRVVDAREALVLSTPGELLEM